MTKTLLVVSMFLASCVSGAQQAVDCKAGCEQRNMELVGVAFQSGQQDTVCICKIPGTKLSVNDAAQAILPILVAASAWDTAIIVASTSASAADED